MALKIITILPSELKLYGIPKMMLTVLDFTELWVFFFCFNNQLGTKKIINR